MKKIYSCLLSASFFALTMYSNLLNAQVYLIGNGEFSYRISDNGKVVTSNTTSGSYYWTKELGTQLLGTMPDNVYYQGVPSVSSDGKIIATTITNPNKNIAEIGIFDTTTKTWTYLGSLGFSTDGVASSLWGMTPDSKKLVGLAQTSGKIAHAVYWTKETGLVDIGSTIETSSSRINNVSDDGKIFVGWQDNITGLREGCYWENGEQVIIKDQNGYSVNEIGYISGNGKWMLGSSGYYASKWSKETGLIKIEDPNAGMYYRGSATSSNYNGSVIIGYYRNWPGGATMGQGFIWTEKDGYQNLNDYVKSLGIDNLGVTFSLPLGISRDGKHIVGVGRTDTASVSFLIDLPKDDLFTNESNKVSFDIFPNPTTETINIQTKGKLTSSILYDMNGKLILKSSEKSINVKHLPKGIYILRTVIDGKESTKKIIKK